MCYLPLGNCNGWAIVTSLLCCPTCDMGSCDTCLRCLTCDTLKQVQIPTCPCLLTFRIMIFLHVGLSIMYTRSTETTVPGRVVVHNEDGAYRVEYQADGNFLTSRWAIATSLLCCPTSDVAIAGGGSTRTMDEIRTSRGLFPNQPSRFVNMRILSLARLLRT